MTERIIDGCQDDPEPFDVQSAAEKIAAKKTEIMDQVPELADWDQFADTGAITIIRGTE